MAGDKLRLAMICASNVNRSVAAHETLKDAGMNVSPDRYDRKQRHSFY